MGVEWWSIRFFFEQKTAYEVRISDWSSDVCSSDLEGARGEMSVSTIAAEAEAEEVRQKDWLVIAASSLGTVFEWYDFYLYGLLATIISAQFFSGVNETTGFIFALAAFAAGFAVRPFGALVFGRLGDLVGPSGRAQ